MVDTFYRCPDLGGPRKQLAPEEIHGKPTTWQKCGGVQVAVRPDGDWSGPVGRPGRPGGILSRPPGLWS